MCFLMGSKPGTSFGYRGNGSPRRGRVDPRGYGWACETILNAELGPTPYDGWLRRHGHVLSRLGGLAETALDEAVARAPPTTADSARAAAETDRSSGQSTFRWPPPQV